MPEITHAEAVARARKIAEVCAPNAAAVEKLDGAWDTDPQSFCFGAVKNTVTPFG